ncbi:MAG: GSCFA domain-containing protein [Ginsengibacter sp.]
MELILPFKVTFFPKKISYTDKILFIGSCFSEEIGARMSNLKFDVLQNPNGILYDPISISSALDSYIINEPYEIKDLFFQNDLWHSWHHHSVFSGLDKQEVLRNIFNARVGAHQFLKNTSWLIISLGTSFNYSLKNERIQVANCHKAPAGYFKKKLITIEETIAALSASINNLREFNADLKIIFTISPVRHVKDGVVENNRSKARLLEAVHFISEKFQDIFYFPAYELIIDVLRDYRFYKNDLVHPTDAAIDFVFESFCNSLLDEPGKKLLEEIKQVVAARNHKPFQKESAAHKNFRNTQLEKINKISEKFPGIDFTKEKQYFAGD